MTKYIDVKLRLKPLLIDEAETILTEFEEKLRTLLTRKLRRRLEELDILIEADYSTRDELKVRVDVSATGRVIAPLTYDEVIAEAIDEAARWLETRLRSRVDAGESQGAREDNSRS